MIFNFQLVDLFIPVAIHNKLSINLFFYVEIHLTW